MEELVQLRRELHQFPEVSHDEFSTAERIANFLCKLNPDELVKGIGGNGIMCVFKGKEEGPNVAIRAELDALPIHEINDFEYHSIHKGVGHKCGHDGHMAIVAGLASLLSLDRPKKGNVILLFQPAEETGDGALQMINDPKYLELMPDYIFALHNLPGYPKGQIVTRESTFAAASKGLIIELFGKTSHAAEPENGVSPSRALAAIIDKLESLNNKSLKLSDFAITTVVHTLLGSESFGITPGYGKVLATIRAYNDNDLKALEDEVRSFVADCTSKYNLKFEIAETEVFASTINDAECYNVIENAAGENGYEFKIAKEPFRWSEDFGEFTQRISGAMFGLGSGEDTPDLHNPDYDFPDDIIPYGVNMFNSIINQLLNN